MFMQTSCNFQLVIWFYIFYDFVTHYWDDMIMATLQHRELCPLKMLNL